MKIGIKKFSKILLILLIIFTVASIFMQSTKSKEESKSDSDKVGEIIEEIIPPETPAGDYVQTNLRKIAHFIEFFLLGIEVSLFVSLFHFSKIFVPSSLVFGLLVAAIDETIQIFSKRGPSVRDVMIDFSGFLVSALIIYTLSSLIKVISQKRKQK